MRFHPFIGMCGGKNIAEEPQGSAQQPEQGTESQDCYHKQLSARFLWFNGTIRYAKVERHVTSSIVSLASSFFQVYKCNP